VALRISRGPPRGFPRVRVWYFCNMLPSHLGAISLFWPFPLFSSLGKLSPFLSSHRLLATSHTRRETALTTYPTRTKYSLQKSAGTRILDHPIVGGPSSTSVESVEFASPPLPQQERIVCSTMVSTSERLQRKQETAYA
jgi:hypothetical protein